MHRDKIVAARVRGLATPELGSAAKRCCASSPAAARRRRALIGAARADGEAARADGLSDRVHQHADVDLHS